MQILTGAAALMLSAPLLPAQTPAPAPSAAPGGPADPLPTDPVPQLSAALSDPSKTQTQRDEAASALLARVSPQFPAAADALRTGLAGSHDEALAVARAIANGPAEPDQQWVKPLTGLLGLERQLSDAACRALARYSEDATARQALTDFARDNRHNSQERAAAAEALGAFVDKPAADALVTLLENPRESTTLTTAVAGALEAMTGITDYGQDPRSWRNWLNGANGLTEAQWKAQVYPGHMQRLQQLENRQHALASEVDTLLLDEYQNAPDAQKNALVMRFLDSPAPDVRATGANIVHYAVHAALPFPPKAPDRLAELVGDDDARVRLQAAQALQVLGYAPALNALLQQLAIETHADVKIALLGAISGIDDTRSLPVLRKLLHDPSIAVAIASAHAIKQLGGSLYKNDPATARATAEELWQTIRDRGGDPRAAEFKAAVIEAMAPLKDTAQSTEFPKLLNNSEPEAVREAALHALRELGDKNTSDAIASWLTSEPNAALRADAIEALNTTGNFVDDAQVLYDQTRSSPNGGPPDPAVRDKAWLVWDSLLGGCTDIATLNNWQQTLFKDGNVQQRILVLNQLNDNLRKQNQLADLAISEQQTGDAYMQIGRPDAAAVHYQNAWDYWANHNIQNANTAALVDDQMKALLQSKQYDKAVKFGQAAMQQDQEAVGKDIRETVDQLAGPAATHTDAATLIDLALKMNPPIPEPYHQDLVATQKQISGGK